MSDPAPATPDAATPIDCGIQQAPPLSEMGEHALLYAQDRGWKVFPCAHKRPLTAHGFHDASTDPEQIERWWTAHPLAQIAAPCVGFWVLDVDGEEGDRSFSELVQGRPLYTAIARTARGRHYFFRIGATVPRTTTNVLRKIDIRAAGSYVIVAPSIHETGARYAWETPLDDMTEAPAWLLDALAKIQGGASGPVPASGPRRAEHVNEPPVPLAESEAVRLRTALSVIPADDYHTWVEIGMALQSTRAGGPAFDLWDAWSSSASNYAGRADCWKKWTSFGRRAEEITVATIFHHEKKIREQMGQLFPHPSVPPSAQIAESSNDPDEPGLAVETGPLPPPVVLGPIARIHANPPRGLATTPPPKRKWVIVRPNGDGLLAAGKVCAIASAGGVGKTTVAVQLAASLATGRPWLGTFAVAPDISPRSLLLLGEDDEGDAHRTVAAICDGLGLLDSERELFDMHCTVLPLSGEPAPLAVADPKTRELEITRHFTELAAILEAEAQRVNAFGEAYGYSLVVIDTLARFGAAEIEIDNAVATRMIQALERLAASQGKPCVLLTAHTAKAGRKGEDVDTSIRGSSALGDSLRVVLGMASTGPDTATLALTKCNIAGPMEPLQLVRNSRVWRSLTSAEAERRQAEDAANVENAALEKAKVKAEVQDKVSDFKAARAKKQAVDRVVEFVREHPGHTQTSIRSNAGIKSERVPLALATAVELGLIVATYHGSVPHYHPADPDSDRSDSDRSVPVPPPHPPHGNGNGDRSPSPSASLGLASGSFPRFPGTGGNGWEPRERSKGQEQPNSEEDQESQEAEEATE